MSLTWEAMEAPRTSAFKSIPACFHKFETFRWLRICSKRCSYEMVHMMFSELINLRRCSQLV